MTAPIAPDERATIRARAEAATPGPWELIGGGEYVTGVSLIVAPDDGGVTPADALFIAAARTAVPRLLDALDTAEAERDEARAASARVREAAARVVADEAAESDLTIARQRDRLRSRQEQVRRLRAEVTRLHALVADLRAAPVWDEDTVTEAVASALREHGGWSADLPDDEMDCCATAVLAVVRRHLPVKPGREAVALKFCLAQDSTEHMEQTDDAPCSRCLAWADAVLAEWPGESRAQARNEAVQEVIDFLDSQKGDADAVASARLAARCVQWWLDARADRIEGGANRG